MSTQSSSDGYNAFYDIDELPFTDDQKEIVLEYLAQKYWKLQQALDIRDGHCKTYDPLIIEDGTAHSYVFDMEDGGRHHTFKSYRHLEQMLDSELLATVKGEQPPIDNSGELKAKNLL